MKFRPLHDRVLIERIDQSEKTAGGIIIPDTAQEKPMQGKVLAVGAGSVTQQGARQKMQVHEGDRILFSNYAGTEISVDDMDVLILSESEILAIVE